ncbi:pyrokinin-1 receptor [Aplysia californica]|uniref:Pyrokinin-1 receptor n=1 Tax=Aplysia californica TaxID=6500 RepID=A0ABM0JYL9_APLCA|nr:pyrokinin-1 receptor [Aplysia californica]
MRTVTNHYLFSLAVSDVLTLLFALPPELYSIWEAYPWHLGEPFCIFKSFLTEMTSYASVLTITSFTVERYLAICHPIRGQRSSRQSRAVKIVLSIWVVSGLCALPYPIHTRVFAYLNDPRTHRPILDSALCNIPFKWQQRMSYSFQVSTFVFFVIPMAVITIMYLMIGFRLRSSALATSVSSSQSQTAKTAASRARRAVLKMLVAVVVAFFICFAPFHAQRLMTLYIRPDQWTPELLLVQSNLFYVSGVLYFMSSTVNPILYNVLSRKFRQAFKRTLCRCCLRLNSHSIPAFYKLKAKFVGGDHARAGSHGNSCYLYPNNAIRLANLAENEAVGRKGGRLQAYGYAYPSTNETSCKNSSPTQNSNSATHAHSDGRLHRLCRHKYCSSRRANHQLLLPARGEGLLSADVVPCDVSRGMPGPSSGLHETVATPTRRTIISYPDIHCGRRYCHSPLLNPALLHRDSTTAQQQHPPSSAHAQHTPTTATYPGYKSNSKPVAW